VSKTDLLRAALCAPDENDASGSGSGSGGSGAGAVEEDTTQGHNASAAATAAAAAAAAAEPEPAEAVAGLTVEEMVRQLMAVSGNPPHAHLLDLLVRQKMDPYTKAIITSPPSRSNCFDDLSPLPPPPPHQRQAEEELVEGNYGRGTASAEDGEYGAYHHDDHDDYHDSYDEDVDGPRVIASAHGPWPTTRAFADASSTDEVVRIVMAAPPGPGRLRARLQLVEQRAVTMALRRLQQQQQQQQQNQGTDSHALLAALNAITAVLRRHDMPVSRGLCELGLELSAELRNSVALRRYLIDSESGGHLFTAKLWERVLDDLVSPLVSSPAPSAVSSRPPQSLSESGVAQAKPTGKRRRQQQQQEQQQRQQQQQQQLLLLGAARVGSWQRRDVLQLLTGGQAAGVSADGSATSEPSIARCIDPDCLRTVEVYVRALQKLGAVSSIHSYWLTIRARLLDAAAAPQKAAAAAAAVPATEQRMAANAAALALVFARALAGAGDRAGAVRLLLTAPSPLDDGAQGPLQSRATAAAGAAENVQRQQRQQQQQQQQQQQKLAALVRLDCFLRLVHPLYAGLSARQRDVLLLAPPWLLSSSSSSSSLLSSSLSSSSSSSSSPKVTLRNTSDGGGGGTTTTTTTTSTTDGAATSTTTLMEEGEEEDEKGKEKKKKKKKRGRRGRGRRRRRRRSRKEAKHVEAGAALKDDHGSGNGNGNGVALPATTTVPARASSLAMTRQLLQSFERLLGLRWVPDPAQPGAYRHVRVGVGAGV
jgi:hypothetical protein